MPNLPPEADAKGDAKDGGAGADAAPASAVVIAGMHRSGTSLVASLLQRAGVHVGDELLGAHESNPHGHFEDVDFLEFHRACLDRLGVESMPGRPITLERLGRDEIDRAAELVAAKRRTSPWGWKDPRSCLFLGFWSELLPEARFVFVYRDPIEVVLSLLRRGSDRSILVEPKVGLDAWKSYNGAILRHFDSHPDRCFLVEIREVARAPAAFVTAVAEKLDLSLEPTAVAGVVHREDLHDGAWDRVGVERVLEAVDGEAYRWLQELRARAKSLHSAAPAPAPAPGATGRPVLEGLADWVERAAPDEALASAVFTVLLTLLQPGLVTSKRELLLEEIHSLRVHVTNLESLLENRGD